MISTKSLTDKPRKPTVVIYSCKRCKTGRRVEYPGATKGGGVYRTDEAGKRINAGIWRIGTTRSPMAPAYGFVLQRGDAYHHFEGDPLGVCPSCNRAMAYGRLSAYRNASVRCDARCTNARGHDCECSCGGENHGSGWAVGGAKLSKLLAEVA